jgi:hypothetical protein
MGADVFPGATVSRRAPDQAPSAAPCCARVGALAADLYERRPDFAAIARRNVENFFSRRIQPGTCGSATWSAHSRLSRYLPAA